MSLELIQRLPYGAGCTTFWYDRSHLQWNPRMPTTLSSPKAEPSLGSLGPSPAMERLLIHFALHPEVELHFRALRRHTDLGIASLQTELARLVALGLILREKRGRYVLFKAHEEHPGWPALRELIRHFADPVEVLRDALAEVRGIDAAFLFGSFARRDAVGGSDLDLFLLGSDIDPAELGGATLASSVLLAREVNVCRYSTSALRERLGNGSGFLRRVLQGPKRWIVGSEQNLSEAA